MPSYQTINALRTPSFWGPGDDHSLSLSIIINQHNNDSQFFEKLKDIAIVAFLKYDFILFLGAEGICVQLVGSFSCHGSFSYAMKCLNGVM